MSVASSAGVSSSAGASVFAVSVSVSVTSKPVSETSVSPSSGFVGSTGSSVEEERMTRFFNTLDEADEALALFAGLESKKDISMYLRNPNCKYEIRATTKQD